MKLSWRYITVIFVCLFGFAFKLSQWNWNESKHDQENIYDFSVSISNTVSDQSTEVATSSSTNSTASPPRNILEKFYNFSGILSEPRTDFVFTILPWNTSYDSIEYINTDIRWSMIVMVKTHSKNFEERKIIRRTWGREKFIDGVRMETVFIVANALDDGKENLLNLENETYGDILKMEMKETYENVGYKTLAGMQYASALFPSDWMYTSADDDISPDLKKMREKVDTMVSSKNNVTEKCDMNSTISILCGHGCVKVGLTKRDKRNKWYLSKEFYPLKIFPSYCAGAWYTMSVDTTRGLYNISKTMHFFWIDDIWITGMLRLKYIINKNIGCNFNDTSIGLPIANTESFVMVGKAKSVLG